MRSAQDRWLCYRSWQGNVFIPRRSNLITPVIIAKRTINISTIAQCDGTDIWRFTLSSKKQQRRVNKRVQETNYTRNNVIDLDTYRQRKTVRLVPRSVSQEHYVDALLSQQIHIVFAVGPAGTGKTKLATEAAILGYEEGRYEKIVITRPNVACDDRDIGFLPGDILSKMAPWMMPILDVFAEYYSQQEIAAMIAEKVIEMVPIAFIRGRTFKNACVIVDEAQGTTKTSMMSILTRIGENSKMIVTGDIKQSDRGDCNGLTDFLSRYNEMKVDGMQVITFSNREVIRHPIIKDVLKMYNEE